jgi:L-ascorbate metabolism protein UlaG (beta-lactamase superfamily)
MNSIDITYAGHSAVFVEMSGMTIAIDPWLKGNPLCPESLLEPEAIDVIALTHGHSDHASDVVRVQACTDASVVATYELAMILVKEGVPADKVIPMNKGGACALSDALSITLTNAFHSSSYDTLNGPVYAGEACGLVVSNGTSAVYHAGDTLLFEDMKRIGQEYSLTAAFLPIGDRFTMGPREAAQAAQLLSARVAIPIHYNTFPLLTGTYEEFSAACRSLDIAHQELIIGETTTLS